MKHIKTYKLFEDKGDTSLMDKYIGIPLLCLRLNNKNADLDCSIFTDENISGYGLGLGGDFFKEWDFEDAIIQKGDGLNRYLYKAEEVDKLIKKLGFESLSKEKAIDRIIELVKRTRSGYSSGNPEAEKKMGLYVDIDELRDLLEGKRKWH